MENKELIETVEREGALTSINCVGVRNFSVPKPLGEQLQAAYGTRNRVRVVTIGPEIKLHFKMSGGWSSLTVPEPARQPLTESQHNAFPKGRW